jgi:hypothetical protein
MPFLFGVSYHATQLVEFVRLIENVVSTCQKESLSTRISAMHKLFELGFTLAANAQVDSVGKLTVGIVSHADARNLLYAFVAIPKHTVDGLDDDPRQVFYIGHTRKTFAKRMYGYEYGGGAAVNNRVHNRVLMLLGQEYRVEIYVWIDVLNMSLMGMEVDVAAGLEYSLILYYVKYNADVGHFPLENIAGVPPVKGAPLPPPVIDVDGEEIAQEAVDQPDNNQAPIAQFNHNLKETFWNNRFLNIPVDCERYFGAHNGDALFEFVDIEGNLIRSFSVRINRTANLNGTPRFYIPAGADGDWYQQWKHNHFLLGGVIPVEIVAQNHIRFRTP